MRLINNEIFSIAIKHGVSYPTPSNLNYFWGLGSISGFLLVWQILSGVLLAMHMCFLTCLLVFKYFLVFDSNRYFVLF